MAWKVASNILLSRSVTLNIRDFSRPSSGTVLQIHCWNKESQEIKVYYPPMMQYYAAPNADPDVSCNAYIGNVLLAGISFSAATEYYSEEGEFPDNPCPDLYLDGGGWPEERYRIKRYKNCRVYVLGNPEFDFEPILLSTFDNLNPYYPGIPHAYTFDDTNSVTVKCEAYYDLWAEEKQLTYYGDTRDYVADHDPYGRLSRRVKLWYELATGAVISMLVTWGTSTWSGTIGPERFDNDEYAFREYFKHGFQAASAGARMHFYAFNEDPEFSGWPTEKMAWGSIQGDGIDGITDEIVGSRAFISISGNNFDMWMVPSGTVTDIAARCAIARGEFTAQYSVAGKNFDNTLRSGVVETTDTHDGTAYMTVNLNSYNTFESAGMYYLYADGTEKSVRDFTPVKWSETNQTVVASYHSCTRYRSDLSQDGAGLQNLDAMGEPVFPAPEGQEHWRWFDDSRIDLVMDAPWSGFFSWNNCITLNIASECTLADAASLNWQVSYGQCSISTTNGTLVVTVTSGTPTIEATLPANSYLTGARLIEFGYNSNDTQPIQAELVANDSFSWAIAPGSAVVDAIAPDGRSGVDITQTGFNMYGWRGGVQNVSSIKFAGLRPGGTYQFTYIKGKRIPASSGGFARLEVCNEGFIGGARGENAYSDPWSAGKSMVLIVDGVYALSAGQGYISTTVFGVPVFQQQCGLVSATMGTSTSAWAQPGTAHTYDLVSGIYQGYSSISVDAKLKAAGWELPIYGPGNISLSSSKYLRGGINVLAVGEGGIWGTRSIILEKLLGTSVVSSARYRTDGLGLLTISSLQQPLDGLPYQYVVKVLAASNAGADTVYDPYYGGDCVQQSQSEEVAIVGTVGVRNRNNTQITLIGELL
jgi:hypothetical protein